MQLKMTNKFNLVSAKQLIQEEDKFLSHMFSRMPLPTAEPEEQGEVNDEQLKHKNGARSFPANGNAKRALTSEELHQKFNKLKGERKLSYKQKQLKKGLKNRIKKKSKREERRIQKKLIQTERITAGITLDDKEDIDAAPKVPRAKPVFNSEGHMVFSKFDFSNVGTKKKAHKTDRDPKKILGQLKEKEESLKELVASGETERAMEIQEKDSWKTALAKAGGAKVKDDPELLKRTIKRHEQQKKRSSERWEFRISGVEKAQQEKQRKRTDNIMTKKKERKTNKMNKASKKGRIIPGF